MEHPEFNAIIESKRKFNGKPFSHWQAMADEAVVEAILRAALQSTDQSLPGYIAKKRLFKIAWAENPVLCKKILRERGILLTGFARIMADLLGQSRRKAKRKGRKT